MSNTYKITKQFTSGILKGLSVVEITSTKFAVGFKVAQSNITPSAYIVIAVEQVAA